MSRFSGGYDLTVFPNLAQIQPGFYTKIAASIVKLVAGNSDLIP